MSIDLSAFDVAASHWIRLVGTCIEIFGVFILVAGIAWSTYRYVGWPTAHHYDQYRIRIGRSLLLGPEVLVAADIVKTVAIDLTFTSLGLLAGLVLVRTFLSWTLVLEIEGRWPWQREPSLMSSRARSGGAWRALKLWRAVAGGRNAGVTPRRSVAEPRSNYRSLYRELAKFQQRSAVVSTKVRDSPFRAKTKSFAPRFKTNTNIGGTPWLVERTGSTSAVPMCSRGRR